MLFTASWIFRCYSIFMIGSHFGAENYGNIEELSQGLWIMSLYILPTNRYLERYNCLHLRIVCYRIIFMSKTVFILFLTWEKLLYVLLLKTIPNVPICSFFEVDFALKYCLSSSRHSTMNKLTRWNKGLPWVLCLQSSFLHHHLVLRYW